MLLHDIAFRQWFRVYQKVDRNGLFQGRRRGKYGARGGRGVDTEQNSLSYEGGKLKDITQTVYRFNVPRFLLH